MLRQARLWTWLGVVASIGLVVVTTIASVDHVRKTRDIQQADVDAWYCAHRATNCDETKPDELEDDWSSRERVYKGADVGLALVAGAAVVAVRRRR